MIPKEPTHVEKQVLAAFRADSISVVDVDGAEISGDFLCGLFLGEYDEKADYRGTCVANAIINDVLDMEFRETKFPVRFHDCCFEEEIKIKQLTCLELDFRGCTLKRSFDARMAKVAGSVNLTKVNAVNTVSLANADIGGQLICKGGSFPNKEGCAFHAPDIKVAADVFLSDGFIAAGEVNLAGAEIGRQLVCTGGNFHNKCKIALNAETTKVAGGVVLNDGFNAEGMVSLAGAEIGELNCAGGSFQNKEANVPNALNAQSIKVTGSVFLANGFNAEGEVRLAGADIGGQLICMGGSFQNEGGIAFIAESAKVAAGVALNGGFRAEGMVSLAVADIGGQLVCAGGSFQNKEGVALNAQGIKVADNLALSDGFYAEGIVTLLGADVGGQLICKDGIFQNKEYVALNAQGIRVAADVFLGDGFEAVGVVSLAYADIRGQLACNGSFWNKGKDTLNAQGIKVAGDVLLQNVQTDGKVNFLSADIGGQLSCKGGSFQNDGGKALVAQGIKVASDVFLIPHFNGEREENFSAKGWVLFTNASIGGNLHLKSCKLTHLSLMGVNVLGEFQDNADAYKSDKCDHIKLNMDGFRYYRLNSETIKDRIEDRLEWVGLMSKGKEFFPQPYEQLMQAYRATGHTNWARDVGFALEEKRHGVMKSRLWRCWYRILRHTIGYGYKPFRAITHWFFPLILASLVLFSGVLPCPDPYRAESESCHCMAPSDAEVLLSEDWNIHGKLPKDYPDFNFVYYAVEAALPVLPLGQTENWHPKTWWVRWLQGAITIIGALVLTILASYGVGVLGPRWKGE